MLLLPLRLLLLVVSVCISMGATPFEVPVEHSLQEGKFKRAGYIRGKFSAKGGVLGNPIFVREELPKQDRDALDKLVKEEGFYKLKTPSIPTDIESIWVVASIPARCLDAGGFKESLRLELTDANRIIGLDYRSMGGNCNATGEPKGKRGTYFSDEVEVLFSYPLSAPHISMEEWLATFGDEDDPSQTPGQQRGQKGKEKTFLQQNWMFVLAGAFIVFQIMGNLNDDDGGQGGNPGGGGGGGRGRGGGFGTRGGRLGRGRR